jgi:LemA protein
MQEVIKMIGLIFGGIGIVLGLFIIILLGWGIGSYNTFVTAMQDIKNMFSNIKTEYQRRADLIYNLVESVKGYQKFEKETLTEVIKARQGINFGKSQQDQMKKMGELDKFFSKLAVVFEKYPKLKTNEQYNTLTKELKLTENRINIARTDYNSIVRDYNIFIKEFPRFILANMFGFKEELFFENEKGTEKAPKIKLTE